MTERAIGVIGLPGGWSTEALADAVAERTGRRIVIDMEEVALDTTSGTVRYRDLNLAELDGIVIKKMGREYSPQLLDRLQLLRAVEARGVRILSRPTSILRLIDRLSGTVTLNAAGIPMPPTTVTESIDIALRAVTEYGTAVLKPLYSTKARGMQILSADDLDGVRAILESFQAETHSVLYLQQKLEIPERDLGVVFLGGEYVGTYCRVRGPDSWNTTIHDGGHYAGYEPGPDIIELARSAQALFDLDYTSVDVVETADGPLVFEVSAFGGFRGLMDGLGIDGAARVAEYAVKAVAGG